MISKDQLHISMPQASAENIEKFLQPLNETMEKFAINTFNRQTIFLAQIAHESGCLRYTKELASGAAYDVGNLATRLGNTPEDDGDGERLKGRGLIQITGTTNYRALGEYFGQDFIAHPELLEGPVWACMSAGWFWNMKNLNNICDQPPNFAKSFKGKVYNRFEWVTLLINGGQNGLTDRLKYYELAKKALS